MRNYHEFHDGFLDGIWFDGERVHVCLSTLKKAPFTLVAGGVAALSSGGFRKGNLIFEVLVKTQEEITLSDVATIYELREGDAGRDQGDKLLKNAHDQKLEILEINPSYGASCLILAESFDLLTRKEWLERYLATLSGVSPAD